jgi:hypothetical protein
MIAKTVFILLAFHSSILGSVTSDSSVRDTLALKLHKRVAAYNLGVCTPVEGLIRVSSDFQIPIGIVWVNTPEATAESSFAWKDATVQEIIKTLAKAQPRYQFESRNGVVHVFPPGAIPRSQDFLKLKIESFEVRNDLIELASFKLHTH